VAALDVERRLLPLVNRDIVPRAMADVMLPGPDDLVFGVVQELVPVGQPPSHPGDHE